MLQDPLVFDASVLFNVGHRGELRDLLRKLKITHLLLVPPVVVDEVSAEPSFDYHAFCSEYFIIRRGNVPPEFLTKLAAISARLNAGEIEVILLSAAVGGTAVIDERAGRSVAMQLGIPVTGTLGLLQFAVSLDWINDRQAIDVIARLRSRGFRVPPTAGYATLAEYLRLFEQ